MVLGGSDDGPPESDWISNRLLKPVRRSASLPDLDTSRTVLLAYPDDSDGGKLGREVESDNRDRVDMRGAPGFDEPVGEEV